MIRGHTKQRAYGDERDANCEIGTAVGMNSQFRLSCLQPTQSFLRSTAQFSQINLAKDDEAVRKRAGAAGKTRIPLSKNSKRCMFQRMILTDATAQQYVIKFHCSLLKESRPLPSSDGLR